MIGRIKVNPFRAPESLTEAHRKIARLSEAMQLPQGFAPQWTVPPGWDTIGRVSTIVQPGLLKPVQRLSEPPIKLKRRSGRPKGSGYQQQDEALVEEMRQLIATGAARHVTAAAWMVVDRAAGASVESRVSRLVGRLRRKIRAAS